MRSFLSQNWICIFILNVEYVGKKKSVSFIWSFLWQKKTHKNKNNKIVYNPQSPRLLSHFIYIPMVPKSYSDAWSVKCTIIKTWQRVLNCNWNILVITPCETHLGYKFSRNKMDQVKDEATVSSNEASRKDEG